MIDDLKERAEEILERIDPHLPQTAALIRELMAERERLTALAERWEARNNYCARCGPGAEQDCARELRTAMEGTDDE